MRLWRITVSRRGLWVLLPAASALLGAALVVVMVKAVLEGGAPDRRERAVAPTTIAPPTGVPIPPSESPAERLMIPKIDVDAPLEQQSVEPDGLMPIPSGPEVVAQYEFSAYHPGQEHRVGFGGNAVF